ncbi:Nitrilase, arylacetone-specific [Diplodia seriata]|uniref:nitrilase n=1 Tax=Diplodia seriata TaxID=420778 RepID=A0A1S8BKK8_9PEZI|nr:Nitrilase, arylacetone-specific [Diplodia seriata]
MRVTSFLFSGLSALSATTHAFSTYNTANATSPFSNLTVAIVRAPPANWPSPFWNKNWTGVEFDLNATISKATNLISEAADAGANLVVFPELWFPGYPKGIDDAWIASTAAESYINNSLSIGSAEWRTLLASAASNGVYLALAYSELTDSAIYMGQALISSNGSTLITRRKLRPSGIERSFWSDGDIDGFQVANTPFGRWGILECWEHFHPSMTFPMQAQLEDVHIASFPYMPDANDATAQYWEALEVNAAAARTYAVNAGAVTLFAAVGHAAVYDGTGIEVASIEQSVDYDERPILYASVNATAFRREAYDVDGEQSWGTLQQVVDAFPAYIPKVEGTFVEKKTVLIADLLAGIQ